MKRTYHQWFSPALGRTMELLLFGHGGARVLVFPTSMGRFYEWEDRGMIQALAPHLENGWLQLICLDSVDKESWYAKWKAPNDRARRQTQYENYILQEVFPFWRPLNPNPFLVTVGASFGAFHALDFALRHPHLVGRAIGLSGFYDVTRWTDGYGGDEIYFHNPCAFLANEQQPERLEAMRHMDIILAVGRDDPLRQNNEYLSGLLWAKGIWHALRLWDGWCHDWPYWIDMIRLYIGGHD